MVCWGAVEGVCIFNCGVDRNAEELSWYFV